MGHSEGIMRSLMLTFRATLLVAAPAALLAGSGPPTDPAQSQELKEGSSSTAGGPSEPPEVNEAPAPRKRRETP